MASNDVQETCLKEFNKLNNEGTFKDLHRIKLLKKLESVSKDVFVATCLSPTSYSAEKLVILERASCHSNFEGIQDFSEDFYEALALASKRQNFMRQFVLLALEHLDHQFCTFDSVLFSILHLLQYFTNSTHYHLLKTLLKHSTKISAFYDEFYVAWSKAVQGNKVATMIEEYLNNGKGIPKSFYNHYTIVKITKTSKKTPFGHRSYYTVFKEQLDPIIAEFNALIAALKAINESELNDQQKANIPYLQCYADCLAETSVSKLEEMNTQLDRLWMDIKYHIQIVHDIEYGYGDPLRVKAIPDFSIRFVDEEYSEANNTISKIQDLMVKYFEARDTALSKKGLFALSESFAAIYYIPFQTGMSLHFRFSGQSIPNRSEVKNEKGVKIYFDPISTAARQVQTEELVKKVYNEPDTLCSTLGAIPTLVYQVAAHEVGHAIYGLDHVKEVIKSSTRSLLEEPRAELTALHTMLLLQENDMISIEEVTKHLISFAIQDLRRFAMFDSTSLRPYTISAINTYRIYEEQQFITLNKETNKLEVDKSKAVNVLKCFRTVFEEILDAEDNNDGEKLESILASFEVEHPLSKWLVAQLFNKKA